MPVLCSENSQGAWNPPAIADSITDCGAFLALYGSPRPLRVAYSPPIALSTSSGMLKLAETFCTSS